MIAPIYVRPFKLPYLHHFSIARGRAQTQHAHKHNMHTHAHDAHTTVRDRQTDRHTHMHVPNPPLHPKSHAPGTPEVACPPLPPAPVPTLLLPLLLLACCCRCCCCGFTLNRPAGFSWAMPASQSSSQSALPPEDEASSCCCCRCWLASAGWVRGRGASLILRYCYLFVCRGQRMLCKSNKPYILIIKTIIKHRRVGGGELENC